MTPELGPFEVPGTVWGLFAMIVVTLLAVVVGFIRDIRKDQAKIGTILDTHLGSIAVTLTGLQHGQQLMLNRVLERALRKAEDGDSSET